MEEEEDEALRMALEASLKLSYSEQILKQMHIKLPEPTLDSPIPVQIEKPKAVEEESKELPSARSVSDFRISKGGKNNMAKRLPLIRL